MAIKRLAIDSIFLSLLIISAFINITVPVSEIAFTLQVLIVFLLAFTLPFKDAIIIIFTYIIMGLIGLPVFSAGGGLSYLIKPTFGFILGFITIPCINALIAKFHFNNHWLKKIISGIISLVSLYIFGMIYFYLVKNVYLNAESKIAIGKIFSICVLPFIPIDITKMILAMLISERLNKIIKF